MELKQPYLFVNPLKELHLYLQVLQLFLQSNAGSSGCVNILPSKTAIKYYFKGFVIN